MGILRKEYVNLKNNFGVKRIGIFGSFAKGKQSSDSDIDILVDFEKPMGLEFMDFVEYLEKILGRKIDILTSEGVNSIRVKKIVKDIEGGVVYVQ